MLIYPHAKINIGLYVTGKRDDGFHNIESLFFPIGISDILEFISDPDLKEDVISITGLKIPGDSSNNLVLKACAELRGICDLPYIRIHLHKRIPLGAGLGGGSADAAFLLLELAKIASPVPGFEQVRNIALSLGSDCPFFLMPVSSLARGRGEILKEYSIRLQGLWLSIFNPGIHVSTAEAYANVKPDIAGSGLEDYLGQPVETWKEYVKNSFEPYIFRRYPLVGEIKNQLYKEGAVYASMSGSGSSVFSLSREKIQLPDELQKYHIWSELL